MLLTHLLSESRMSATRGRDLRYGGPGRRPSSPMQELKNFASSVAVVVSSCDTFFDAWRPFAFFWRKYWPECPFPVHLIVNRMRLRSKYLAPLEVGEDRGWASNMKAALQQITQPRVLYLQEDYFLNAPVNEAQLAQDFQYAFEHDVDSLCFRARSEVEPGFQAINERFGIVPLDSDGRARCQLTLWKRDAFQSILREGETAWEMESRGSERTRGMKILSYHQREDPPVPYLMSAIVRGLWTPEALAFCAREDCAISPPFRGTYSENSFLRKWRRARTRTRLREALRSQGQRVLDLDQQTD